MTLRGFLIAIAKYGIRFVFQWYIQRKAHTVANMFEILQMTHHQFDTMSKRLDHNSREVMLRFGRKSQDPIDIIVAAYEDEHIFAEVRSILEQSVLTHDIALEEARRVRDRHDFKSVKGSDGIQLESFTPDMRGVLNRLVEDFAAHAALTVAERNQNPWNWTKQLVRYALAAVTLRSH